MKALPCPPSPSIRQTALSSFRQSSAWPSVGPRQGAAQHAEATRMAAPHHTGQSHRMRSGQRACAGATASSRGHRHKVRQSECALGLGVVAVQPTDSIPTPEMKDLCGAPGQPVGAQRSCTILVPTGCLGGWRWPWIIASLDG